MNRLSLRCGLDFYSGLLLVAIAVCATWLVSGHEVGTAREMGPAYFPLLVSALLGAIGLAMTIKGFIVAGPPAGAFELRPLVAILASFVAFGLLMERAGMIAAILAQVAIAHFATPETRPAESVLFGVGLAAFSALLFVYLLGVPMPLLPAGLAS